ncbi:MAG: chorismate synthase [Anaerolineae bacterium]
MLRFLSAGESHGPALTVILDGIPAGMPLATECIDRELARRQKGYGAGPRMKIEKDSAEILSGVMAGETTGAPIGLLVRNEDHAKWKGKAIAPMSVPRPGHADLTGALKYGYADLRPALERASARETAMRVAVGAVCKQLLAEFGIRVGGYAISIGTVSANVANIPLEERIARAEASDVRCPDDRAAADMREAIEAIIHARNTLGGVLEIVAWNVPAGLGSFTQWDKRLEARLAMALMSVQAIKGVEVGDAFANTMLAGTEVQDGVRLNEGAIIRSSNRAGGIEAGISNGEPIIVRAAMKAIATTLTPQQAVDLATGEEVQSQYERSDFCPVPRAVPILEAMMAFVIADALLEKLGGDSIREMLPRFGALRRATLEDLPMDGVEHTWWE